MDRSTDRTAPPVVPTFSLSWLDPDQDGRWTNSPKTATTALASVFTEPSLGGAILTGEVGDRRDTIESALAEVTSDQPVFRLHGSPFAAATTYGALTILLSAVEGVPPNTLHGMVRVLAQHLRPEDADPAIIILSQPDQVDPNTITVLMHLVQLHAICLIVHTDRLEDVPAELVAMRRNGSLAGIAVLPVTPSGARVLMEQELEGPTSAFAAAAFWRHSGGSVSRLRQALVEAKRTGKLRLKQGHWVMMPGEIPTARSTGMPSVMRELPVSQRRLAEMLAVVGSLRVGDVIRMGSASELDELIDLGLVEIRNERQGGRARVVFVDGDVAESSIESERRRELTSQLNELDPQHLNMLHSVGEKLAQGEAHAALDALRSREQGIDAQERARSLPLTWAEGRSLLAIGDVDAVEQLLDRYQGPSTAPLNILRAATANIRGDVLRTHRLLDELEAMDHPELLAPVEIGYTGESVRCLAMALRAEAKALADDQVGALRILSEIDRELDGYQRLGIAHHVIGSFDRGLLAERFLHVLVAAGQVDACRDVADVVISARHGNPYAAQYGDLVQGVLEVMDGQLAEAEARADRAICQLELVGNSRHLQLASALKAFSSSKKGAAEDVESSLLMDEFVAPRGAARQQATAPSWGGLGWLAELMLARSTAEIHSSRARTARVMALADHAASQGLVMVEFSALASAFQLGDLTVAGRLAVVAEATQTVASWPNFLMARSVLEENPDLMVQALELLAAGGYNLSGDWAPSPLLSGISPHELRRISEISGAARARAESNKSMEPQDGMPPWMAELTRREREVCQLVIEGKTNAMIARIHSISVRTVEGHLYQIYAKLQIKGRAELARLATASVPSTVDR